MTQPCVRYSIHDAAFKSNRFCLQSACRSFIFNGCAAEYKIGRYRSQHQKLTLKICFGETQHTRIKVMTAARMVVTGYPHILNSHSRPGCFLRSTIRENTDSNPAQAADKGAHHQKRHEVTGPYENHCHHRINH